MAHILERDITTMLQDLGLSASMTLQSEPTPPLENQCTTYECFTEAHCDNILGKF